MKIKLIGEVYKLGISIGLFTIQDVIRWADTVIEQLDIPPYELIDLSLSSINNVDTVIQKLMELKGEFNPDVPPKIILGILNNYLDDTQDMIHVIQLMDKLVQYLPACCEWIESEIHFLSDEYYLAEQKIYGNVKELFHRLGHFLDQFKDYTKYWTSALV